MTGSLIEQYDADIRLRGHVTWVGKSSFEATMEVDQQDDMKEWLTVTKARFVMVARDPLNKGPALVNPLVPETDEEKALFQKGEGQLSVDIFFSCRPPDGSQSPKEFEIWNNYNYMIVYRKQNSQSPHAIAVPVQATAKWKWTISDSRSISSYSELFKHVSKSSMKNI